MNIISMFVKNNLYYYSTVVERTQQKTKLFPLSHLSLN